MVTFLFHEKKKYVIWYDKKTRCYFTYNVRSGLVCNISRYINTNLSKENWDRGSLASPYWIADWTKEDSDVIIYDRYDIWRVDPSGIRRPVQITNGYGRKNNIVFRYSFPARSGAPPVFCGGDTVLICAFNERSKMNGFYKTTVHGSSNPIKLIMSPELMYFSQEFRIRSFSKIPDQSTTVEYLPNIAGECS